MRTDTAARYTFDNNTREATTQLRLLAEILDEHTLRVLLQDVLPRLALDPGWRGLDIGSGAGTIACWLADLVAPEGRVTALDTQPHHIPTHDHLDIRQADITTATLPEDHFDLIHARLVLMHLPDRDQVLTRLVQALRPGGILMLSDWDCTNPHLLLRTTVDGGAEAFDAFQQALLGLATANGADLSWARRIPLAMRTAGLTGIEGTIHNRLWAGGQPGCLLHVSNSRQLEPALLDAGMTPQQLSTLRQAMVHPDTLAYSYLMVTAVGRRPTTSSQEISRWSAPTP